MGACGDYALPTTDGQRVIDTTLDEFLRYLAQEVQRYRKDYSLNEGNAFGMWYAIDSRRVAGPGRA